MSDIGLWKQYLSAYTIGKLYDSCGRKISRVLKESHRKLSVSDLINKLSLREPQTLAIFIQT